ncbi:MAG: hypothetical protein L0241_19645, partial [Planctomycetia bacterium]|nr:hypothetical protein [Planctomycetia bacterium]
IAECTKPEAPLLKQVGKVGVITAAGFERIAGELAEAEVIALAKTTAAGMSSVERVTFLQGVISRTPNTAAELTPVLDDAVAAKKADLEAAAAEKAKQAAAAATNRAALERALELSKQDFENELNAIKRQWEALGQKLSDLPAHKRAPEPEPKPQPKRGATGTAPEPKTEEEKDFRRDVANQLAASWRAAWEANKHETRDYLESAMWNISGLKLLGEPGAKVAYSGRYHDSVQGVASNDQVRIVRPGWVLDEDGNDYVVLKAVIQK